MGNFCGTDKLEASPIPPPECPNCVGNESSEEGLPLAVEFWTRIHNNSSRKFYAFGPLAPENIRPIFPGEIGRCEKRFDDSDVVVFGYKCVVRTLEGIGVMLHDKSTGSEVVTICGLRFDITHQDLGDTTVYVTDDVPLVGG